MRMNIDTILVQYYSKGSSYEGNKNHLVTITCNYASYRNASRSYLG